MKTRGHLVVAMMSALILVLAGGCATAPPTLPSTMYINQAVTYLRESPDLNSKDLVELTSGDQVDVLELTANNWVKVRSVRLDIFGYVPKDLLSATQPPPPPAPPKAEKPRLPNLYVAVSKLLLREQPANRSKVVQELPFNTKVEKVEEQPNGWVLVQVPGGSVRGWAPARSLEGFMLKSPKVFKRAPRKAPGKKGEESTPTPEAM